MEQEQINYPWEDAHLATVPKTFIILRIFAANFFHNTNTHT